MQSEWAGLPSPVLYYKQDTIGYSIFYMLTIWADDLMPKMLITTVTLGYHPRFGWYRWNLKCTSVIFCYFLLWLTFNNGFIFTTQTCMEIPIHTCIPIYINSCTHTYAHTLAWAHICLCHAAVHQSNQTKRKVRFSKNLSAVLKLVGILKEGGGLLQNLTLRDTAGCFWRVSQEMSFHFFKELVVAIVWVSRVS